MREERLVDTIDLVKDLYLNGERKTVFLSGPIGIGKTEGVRQLAKSIAETTGKTFVEYKTFMDCSKILEKPEDYFIFTELVATHIEPADLLGFPKMIDSYIEYVPLKWHGLLHKCSGILFIDEYTNVNRMDVKSALLKVTLERRLGFLPLHNDVLVICAGNTPEHSTLANELSEPELNRMMIFHVTNTVDDWKQYMDKNYLDWDKRIYVFLKRHPNYFIGKPSSKSKSKYDGFPSPRAWSSLAKKSHKFIIDKVEKIVYSEVGTEAGAMLMGFLSVQVPELDEITAEMWNKLNVEQKYLITIELAERLKKEIDSSKISKASMNILDLMLNEREYLSTVCFILGREKVYNLLRILSTKHKVSEVIIKKIVPLIREVKGD